MNSSPVVEEFGKHVGDLSRGVFCYLMLVNVLLSGYTESTLCTLQGMGEVNAG